MFIRCFRLISNSLQNGFFAYDYPVQESSNTESVVDNATDFFLLKKSNIAKKHVL